MMFFFSKAMMAMLKILIIDSNKLFRTSLGKSLSSRFPAVEIQGVGSATEGLMRMDSFAPQLIFIDIYLPDKNGLNLAKKIKTFYPKTVISLFTSFDSPEYQKAAKDSGIEHLIPKNDWSSKDIQELVEAVSDSFGC